MQMKGIFLVSAFVAFGELHLRLKQWLISCPSVSAEVQVLGDEGLYYDSRNFDVQLHTNGIALLTTKDEPPFEKISSIQANANVSRLFIIGPLMLGSWIDVSSDTMADLSSALGALRRVIITYKQQRILDQYKKGAVRIQPNYIYFQDQNISGLDILVATNGLTYLKTKRGTVVQATADSLKVKELNGRIKDADLSHPDARKGLQVVSAALAEEAKDWIASAGQ